MYIQDNPSLLDTATSFFNKYDPAQPDACQVELTRVIKDTTNILCYSVLPICSAVLFFLKNVVHIIAVLDNALIINN